MDIIEFIYSTPSVHSLLVPKSCSIVHKDKRCKCTASYVISVAVDGEEYMLGTACNDHFSILRSIIFQFQKVGRIPEGKISFQKVKTIATSCPLNYGSTFGIH